jgi:TIR domain
MEYLAVVLSPDSVDSEWVKREVAMALTEEIANHRVKVLPLLYRDCLLPGFLRDKKYSDFRKPQNYQTTLRQLLKTFGVESPTSVSAPPEKTEDPFVDDTLEDLKRSARILGFAYEFIHNSAKTILSAVLSGGLIRVGVLVCSQQSKRGIGTSYLLSLISRELHDNPFKIDGLFAIVEGDETTMMPYQVNKVDLTNVMIMHWNGRNGREAVTSAIELFWEDLKRQRRPRRSRRKTLH